MLPPIFVITTTHLPKRAAAVQEHLNSLGVSYKLWTGIHGEKVGLASSFVANGEIDRADGWSPSPSNMALSRI